MSIERAEKLKELLTDKYVVVDSDVPELRRFQNWTGTVRTVNMNCRALVEFDGPADIGWYDIDPDYLKVVDPPVKKAPAKASKSPTPEPKPAKTEVAEKTALNSADPLQPPKVERVADNAVPKMKLSPLEMIRKQQAAKAAAAITPPETDRAELVEEVPKKLTSTSEESPFLVDVPLPPEVPTSEAETLPTIEIVQSDKTVGDFPETGPDSFPSETISDPVDVKTPLPIDIDRNDDELKT